MAVAAAVIAILFGTGTIGGSASSGDASGAAPDCLQKNLLHDAALDGGKVDVSPAPGTDTANPATQVSFLGVPSSEIHDVTVRGSSTGLHDGRLEAYSQGDGASFLPAKKFKPGEHVSVHASIGYGGEAKSISFSFVVATPYPTGEVKEFPNPPASSSEYETFHSMPGMQAPILTVSMPSGDEAAGDIFTTTGPGPGRYGALIYAPSGRLIWFDQLPGRRAAEDLNLQTYEGQRDLTLWEGKVLSVGFGEGEDLVLNSHYETVASVKGGNGLRADLHDFQIAPNNISFNTAFNPIRCNLSSVGGQRNAVIIDNAIQEIDMKTGLVRWEWHSVDHVAAEESETSPPKGRPWDWFHLNSIDPQSNGDIFISARNTWAGYELEGGSGKILWRLGGNRSSFKMGPGTKTAWQHDGRILSNGEVSFFDDGANPPVHPQSRAIREKLNMNTHEATLTSSYTHPNPPLLAASQGNVQWLANGDAVVGYGGVPWVSEYNRAGKLIYDAHLPLTMASYRDYRYPWQGEPSTPPALVANLNNTGEETIIHMSWNGASSVASWRILAGESKTSLQAQATVADTGFETSTLLPKKYAYVQIQALNSTGTAIGTSAVGSVKSYESTFMNEGAK